MVARNEGMTKAHNRFHDRTETAEDVKRLRELHAAMDRAVLEAYSWRDLAARAAPVSLDETNEDDHTYQGRLFWPSDFRDEVLARILALNAGRHAEVVRLGIAPGMQGKAKDYDEENELDEGVKDYKGTRWFPCCLNVNAGGARQIEFGCFDLHPARSD